jgi:protocatechuate 3,4-dioxygenase beta subunit
VTDLDCTPQPGAIVEIWHADPTTVQAEELSDSDSVDYDHNSPQMRYRGQLACDENGQYSLHTLKPGWYLNGSQFRPSHIHVKIWVDGVERLTTQLYFKGDPFIESDPWATDAMAVALGDDGAGGQSGQFDFVVDA